MSNMENIPEALFDLIAGKSFQELSAEEKKEVLTHLSEREYTEHREMILEFKSIDSALSFNADTSEFQPKKENGHVKRLSLNYVQVAATIVILVSVGIGFGLYFNRKPLETTPPLVEEFKPIIPEPEQVDVIPVKQVAVEQQLEHIEQVTKQAIEKKGRSLENEDYPAGLVINLSSI